MQGLNNFGPSAQHHLGGFPEPSGAAAPQRHLPHIRHDRDEFAAPLAAGGTAGAAVAAGGATAAAAAAAVAGPNGAPVPSTLTAKEEESFRKSQFYVSPIPSFRRRPSAGNYSQAKNPFY